MKFNQSPEWRWERARELVDTQTNPGRYTDDKGVKRAWQFLHRYRPDDARSMTNLFNSDPSLFEAFRVYDDPENGHRWILEAGVMADTSQDELAKYLNADVDMIKSYENIFFDVRDVLEHRGCIAANVLAPALRNGMLAGDPDFYWKMLAYDGNWEVVKTMWEADAMGPAPRDFFQRVFSAKIIQKGVLAAFSIQVNNFNAVEVINSAMQMMRFEQEAGSAHARDQSQASLKSLINSVDMAVAQIDDMSKTGEETRPISPFDPRERLPDGNAVFAKHAKLVEGRVEEWKAEEKPDGDN